MLKMQEEETVRICLAKVELEKILANVITSLEISDLIKANITGCVECEGYNKECDYYKSQYIFERLKD